MPTPIMFNGKEIIDYTIEYDYVKDYDDYFGYFSYALDSEGKELSDKELDDLSFERDDVIGENIYDYAVGVADFMD
jgi:hypothetical protein